MRSALPARPNINLPQAPHPRHAPPQPSNAALPTSAIGNNGFDNSGIRPVSRFNRGFNEFGYNPWNSWGSSSWNGWNSFSTPYWNTFLSINTVNPAMNQFWTAPAMPMWNPNLFWMNANLNPMWNNFNMNAAWNNMNTLWSPYYGFQNGQPVGPWNGFNPAMNPNGGGINPDAPR
jgi:hypothetical protein